MPKKIKFESFKNQFLVAANEMTFTADGFPNMTWKEFIQQLNFQYERGFAQVSWSLNKPGSLTASLADSRFYVKGDTPANVEKQVAARAAKGGDSIRDRNRAYFRDIVRQVALAAGFSAGTNPSTGRDARMRAEAEFHDQWAESSRHLDMDVRLVNEVCTAPEMRYITEQLGDLRGKKLLDVGCGLGEASVYFALNGAEVTSCDLSRGMLEATQRLAEVKGVAVTPHLAAAEDLKLKDDDKFDVIYAGNLLHHVEIAEALARFKAHIAPGGCLVTWDPLAYNPAINVYRRMATDVRTVDEHPLTWSDIKSFRQHFGEVHTRYFWLTTLVIFVLMALVQRRNPNKERYWKVVVEEGERWKWLYRPLELIDRALLFFLPPLRLLCWNVVLISREPR